MAERMENTFEEMMRDRNGHAETAALTALASSMGSLPGRKTVVFFSEGMSVPATVEAKFRAVIETANRSNVSFYAIDAKGLKVHSEQAATARGIAALRGVGDDDPLQVEENDKRRARVTDLERNIEAKAGRYGLHAIAVTPSFKTKPLQDGTHFR
jgi:hypothetical protein